MKDEELTELIQMKTEEKIGKNHFTVIEVDKSYCKEK